MSSLFENTKNTRLLMADSYRYVRSDVPTIVTEEERKWLLEHNITTVVDLRVEEERLAKVCPLESDERFSYYSKPISCPIPPTVEEVPKSYINVVNEEFNDLIDFISGASSNVLYFCNAGKDRTGVVSAVLLYKAGYSKEDIVNDYMKTKDNLKEMLEAFVKQNPEVDINIITPCECYMEEFLTWYEAHK